MKHGLLVLVSLALILSACSAPAPLPTATSQPQPPATAAPTQTSAAATATAVVVPTQPPATPTTTAPTVTSPPAASPTPAAAFDKMKIIGLDNKLGGYNLVISLPGIQTAYDLKLNGKDYFCVVEAKVPDRIFCQGLVQPPFDINMPVVFSDPKTQTVVYQGNTVLAQAILLRPTNVGWAKTNCPDRGKNVHCEMECRIAPNGQPCTMATCVDLCGAYFSVATCPTMSLTYSSCNDKQWAHQKALYNIP